MAQLSGFATRADLLTVESHLAALGAGHAELKAGQAEIKMGLAEIRNMLQLFLTAVPSMPQVTQPSQMAQNATGASQADAPIPTPVPTADSQSNQVVTPVSVTSQVDDFVVQAASDHRLLPLPLPYISLYCIQSRRKECVSRLAFVVFHLASAQTGPNIIALDDDEICLMAQHLEVHGLDLLIADIRQRESFPCRNWIEDAYAKKLQALSTQFEKDPSHFHLALQLFKQGSKIEHGGKAQDQSPPKISSGPDPLPVTKSLQAAPASSSLSLATTASPCVATSTPIPTTSTPAVTKSVPSADQPKVGAAQASASPLHSLASGGCGPVSSNSSPKDPKAAADVVSTSASSNASQLKRSRRTASITGPSTTATKDADGEASPLKKSRLSGQAPEEKQDVKELSRGQKTSHQTPPLPDYEEVERKAQTEPTSSKPLFPVGYTLSDAELAGLMTPMRAMPAEWSGITQELRGERIKEFYEALIHADTMIHRLKRGFEPELEMEDFRNGNTEFWKHYKTLSKNHLVLMARELEDEIHQTMEDARPWPAGKTALKMYHSGVAAMPVTADLKGYKQFMMMHDELRQSQNIDREEKEEKERKKLEKECAAQAKEREAATFDELSKDLSQTKVND